MVKQAYEFRGYKKGARSIYMRLLHLDPPVVMNIKKIRRLMRKYGLRCPIRQANPYRQMAKAMKTSHVAKNEINRQFRSYAPRKALLTDITYIFYQGGGLLSRRFDVCTHEVLAYRLSDNLRVDFVLDMVDAMCSKYGAELDNSTIVHSDQGCPIPATPLSRSSRMLPSAVYARKGNVLGYAGAQGELLRSHEG
ncbi:MAG: IS3 family transposase [Flavonifractor plautii]